MCSALGRLSVNSAGSSWELVVWGFFFFSSGLRLSVEWALSLPFLGVGESSFSLSFYFLRVEDKGEVKVNLG